MCSSFTARDSRVLVNTFRRRHARSFTGYPGSHHIGPEFQFGHVIGNAIDAPVLLIKTAWGGRSLYEDFRPPSSGLINDVRTAWQRPDLPVVVGETGNGGEHAGDRILAIRKAQAAAVARPEFQGSVAFVKTTALARPAEQSPNTGHGHHWYGNAESYFLIGDALGRAMVQLIRKAE
jgi:hypothetical protein